MNLLIHTCQIMSKDLHMQRFYSPYTVLAILLHFCVQLCSLSKISQNQKQWQLFHISHSLNLKHPILFHSQPMTLPNIYLSKQKQSEKNHIISQQLYMTTYLYSSPCIIFLSSCYSGWSVPHLPPAKSTFSPLPLNSKTHHKTILYLLSLLNHFSFLICHNKTFILTTPMKAHISTLPTIYLAKANVLMLVDL